MCQNIIHQIDRAVNDTPAEQDKLRMYCSPNASWEGDAKRDLAKRRDGGAPSAIGSQPGAP
ncbi:hypothetical protein [Polyangium mundeleinium]|uniref:Uncharacterized protein n=1 Tax=Polyangium mundeleinium TaxID=2995306 RepID=A0ABT5ETV6_9BACT|nr:hypothetical protein [Polyangium mundeleinium]MDC0744618.1 hypothetical protein [Polyangium mundeleinium]